MKEDQSLISCPFLPNFSPLGNRKFSFFTKEGFSRAFNVHEKKTKEKKKRPKEKEKEKKRINSREKEQKYTQNGKECEREIYKKRKDKERRTFFFIVFSLKETWSLPLTSYLINDQVSAFALNFAWPQAN